MTTGMFDIDGDEVFVNTVLSDLRTKYEWVVLHNEKYGFYLFSNTDGFDRVSILRHNNISSHKIIKQR